MLTPIFYTRHLQLGKLIALYDDNKITIDGDTALSFTEDVNKRFEGYGWHTQTVSDGDDNLDAIKKAIEAAQKVTDKPSLIKVRTTIGKISINTELICIKLHALIIIVGFGSKNQGKESVHGSPLDGKLSFSDFLFRPMFLAFLTNK